MGRPGTDPKGFENHGITGRDDLYRESGASNRNPTPAGGASQTPGTDFQVPLDAPLRAEPNRRVAGGSGPYAMAQTSGVIRHPGLIPRNNHGFHCRVRVSLREDGRG